MDTQEDKCLECGRPMWLEGKIEDDYKLCHSCYSMETLRKFYPESGA